MNTIRQCPTSCGFEILFAATLLPSMVSSASGRIQGRPEWIGAQHADFESTRSYRYAIARRPATPQIWPKL